MLLGCKAQFDVQQYQKVLQGPLDENNKASITDKVSFGIEMLYNLLLFFINVSKCFVHVFGTTVYKIVK